LDVIAVELCENRETYDANCRSHEDVQGRLGNASLSKTTDEVVLNNHREQNVIATASFLIEGLAACITFPANGDLLAEFFCGNDWTDRVVHNGVIFARFAFVSEHREFMCG